MKKLIKRDGTYQNYNPYKIEDEIKKSIDATGVNNDLNVF
jgi:ribonucleoside-triphosphate reductase